MCVIMIKKAGEKLPSKDVLKAGFKANSDGCGFATSGGYVWKGLRFGDFYREFTAHVKEDESVMIHFRWATHGSVKKANCHPFTAEVGDNKVVFMHNGVLSIPSANDMTDSEICFRGTIMPALVNSNFKITGEVKRVINKVIGGSKFAILINGDMHLFGSWERYDGLICSNLRFLWAMPDSYDYFAIRARMRSMMY